MIITPRRTWILAVAGVIASLNVAHAATTEELEARLDRMEQMLQQTRSELQDQKQATANAQREAAAARRTAEATQTSKRKQVASSAQPVEQTPAKASPKTTGDEPIGTFHIGKNTTAKIGGYIKADTNYSHYENGDVGKRNELFYTVGGIPVGPDSDKSTDSTQFTAQQTRLHLSTLTKLGGHKIKGYIETDFYGDQAEGQDKVVNDYSPRLRHAYIELDDTWLFGQTWTNFMDMKAYPETLDFIGPTEGQVFVRQAQIRYSKGGFSAATENPETTFEFDSLPDERVTQPTNSDHYPELTLDYTDTGDYGHFSVGALAKTVSSDGDFDVDGLRNTNDKAFGYGLRLSGSFNLTEQGDAFLYQGYYGDGIGRYVAIGAVPAGYINDSGNVETIRAYGGYLDYRHYWSKTWRSNLVLGGMGVDNPRELRNSLITKQAASVHANLLWNPVDPLTLGGEYLYAQREVENGFDGNFNRVQFSAKYDF